jgi:hypothetical protein
VEEFAWILSDALAQLRDSHTWMNWRPQAADRDMTGRRFPAFRLSALNGRFSIAGAKDPSIVDRELLAVNGKPAAEFLSPILHRISAETDIFRAYRFAYEQDFWWWFSNLVGRTQNCCR